MDELTNKYHFECVITEKPQMRVDEYYKILAEHCKRVSECAEMLATYSEKTDWCSNPMLWLTEAVLKKEAFVNSIAKPLLPRE
jgi:hypothetical protein